MTLNDVQRAELALFSARAAGPGASLEQMKAIAYCVRNRVKQGWHDGHWLTVMERADEAAANLPEARTLLDPASRALQRLIADVDDIYYGAQGSDTRDRGPGKRFPNAQAFAVNSGSTEEALNECCYWAWVNKPFTAWFRENVLDRPAEHPNPATMGLMAFFK